MSIHYTYEIIRVDEQARAMEVVYASEGRQTMHIGARLPYEGESVEAVVQAYAPVAYWREQGASVVAPEVGARGSITAADPAALPLNYEALRRLAYAAESDPLFFKAQRGEATLQAWLDKVAEIKARYPVDGPVLTPTASSGLIPTTEV